MRITRIGMDRLRLGEPNQADARTRLRGTTTDPILQITNLGDGHALELRTGPDQAPFTVNRGARVPRLNADRLDGKHARDLAPVTHDHGGLCQPSQLAVGFGSDGALMWSAPP